MNTSFRSKTAALAALTAAALCTGCVSRLTDFTLLSTKNVDLSKAATFQRAPDRVTGEDTVSIIIFIPTGIPNMKEAVDRALQGTPGAVALVDGVVKQKNWWFIFGESGFIVEGTPLVDPSLVSAAPAAASPAAAKPAAAGAK